MSKFHNFIQLIFLQLLQISVFLKIFHNCLLFNISSSSSSAGLNKHQSAVTCLQFYGKFVITSSDDGTVKLWDVKTGRVSWRLEWRHNTSSSSFNPNYFRRRWSETWFRWNRAVRAESCGGFAPLKPNSCAPSEADTERKRRNFWCSTSTPNQNNCSSSYLLLRLLSLIIGLLFFVLITFFIVFAPLLSFSP